MRIDKMNEKEKQIFRKALIHWYRKNQRTLPWRETENPYYIWVSEVMLQQTQVKTVMPYYEKFIQTFPHIDALAKAADQDVLKVWEGLGYYARARNLHKAAQKVVALHQGAIPVDRKTFKSLPGVGDYIASAVMSIAFDQPYAVVDGNVKRVISRLMMISSPVNDAPAHKLFQKHADQLVDRYQPGTFNQAMMELGALICVPKQPRCWDCPVKTFCHADQAGRTGEFPLKKRTARVPQHHIAVGIVYKNGSMLITRRKPEGLLGGLWEFPGGKVGKGESAASACVREIKEEVNLDVEVETMLTRVHHAYTHFRIVMDVYVCRHVSGRVKRRGPVDHRWISIEQIERFPFPRANHKFIPLLKKAQYDNR